MPSLPGTLYNPFLSLKLPFATLNPPGLLGVCRLKKQHQWLAPRDATSYLVNVGAAGPLNNYFITVRIAYIAIVPIDFLLLQALEWRGRESDCHLWNSTTCICPPMAFVCRWRSSWRVWTWTRDLKYCNCVGNPTWILLSRFSNMNDIVDDILQLT